MQPKLTDRDANRPSIPAPQSNIGAVVVIKNHAFAPPVVQIKAGQYVEWRLEDGDTQHSLRGFDPDIAPAFPAAKCGTAGILFTKPGTFSYTCGIHPDMTATVEVK
jgi:plastocyanin